MFETDARGMPRLTATLVFAASLSIAGFLAATGSAATESTQPQRGPAQASGVKVEQGRLSVEVRDMPLAEVLRAIGEQASIQVTIQKGSTEPVTQSFVGLGLDEGIRRLAQGYAVVLIYALDNRTGGSRLAEVRVYKGLSTGDTETFTPRGMAEASPPPGAPTPQGASTPSDPVELGEQQRTARLQAVQDLLQRARQREPGAFASLTEMLASEADPVVRQNVAAALGGIGGAEAVDVLTAALQDQEPAVRRSVVLALGQIGDERLAGPAADLIRNDPDATVRRTAVWALSTLQSDDAHRLISGAITDPDLNVRQAALDTLERWGRPLRPTFAKPTSTN